MFFLEESEETYAIVFLFVFIVSTRRSQATRSERVCGGDRTADVASRARRSSLMVRMQVSDSTSCYGNDHPRTKMFAMKVWLYEVDIILEQFCLVAPLRVPCVKKSLRGHALRRHPYLLMPSMRIQYLRMHKSIKIVTAYLFIRMLHRAHDFDAQGRWRTYISQQDRPTLYLHALDLIEYHRPRHC